MNDVSKQETMPLNVEAVKSANAFLAYLRRYELHPLDVALRAGVRYLTVWNVTRGKPVTRAHAIRIYAGLYALTGVAYTAPIVLLDECSNQSKNMGGQR